MAEAYKCDRCGKLYESEVEKSARKFSIMKNIRYGYTSLDICDDCYKEFVKFMDDGKKDELDKQTND